MDLKIDPVGGDLHNRDTETIQPESPNNRQIIMESQAGNSFESQVNQLEINENHNEMANNSSDNVSKISPISPSKKPNIKDFEILQDLGRGAYAKVCLARYIHNNKIIAIKILDKSFMNKHQKSQEALIEREILTICDHHSIIKLLSTFHDKRKLYFVLEYAPNKDLASFLRSQGILSYETAQFFAAQVLNALIYLHQKNIAHRDLKPENIVLDSEMHVKLVDFSTAAMNGKYFDMQKMKFLPLNENGGLFSFDGEMNLLNFKLEDENGVYVGNVGNQPNLANLQNVQNLQNIANIAKFEDGTETSRKEISHNFITLKTSKSKEDTVTTSDTNRDDIISDELLNKRIKSQEFIGSDNYDIENLLNDIMTSNTLIGTAEYAAPEMLKDKINDYRSTDIWAFGCIIYKFFHGRTPFKASSEREIFKNILTMNFKISSELPESVQDLLSRVLVEFPGERLGSAPQGNPNDLECLKSHSFFKGIDFSKIQFIPLPMKINTFMKKHERNKSADSLPTLIHTSQHHRTHTPNSEELISTLTNDKTNNLYKLNSANLASLSPNKRSNIKISDFGVEPFFEDEFVYYNYHDLVIEDIIENYFDFGEMNQNKETDNVLIKEGLVKRQAFFLVFNTRKLKLFSNKKLELWDQERNIIMESVFLNRNSKVRMIDQNSLELKCGRATYTFKMLKSSSFNKSNDDCKKWYTAFMKCIEY